MTGRYVGARVMRVEDPRFLAGRGVYLDDIEPAGTQHVAFLRSPYAHARIVSVDCTRARALDGVALVVSGEDLRDLPPFTTTIATRPETKTGTRHMLPLDRVRFVGEAVAAVVARSRAIAEDAAELIDVEYERLPAVLDAEAALAPGAPVLHDELGDNNFAHIEFEAGDVDGAFASAAHVFRKRFHFGRTHAAPLEGRGVIADWDVGRGVGDRVDVDADAVPRARHARGAVRALRHARARHLPRRRGRLRPQGAALRRGGDHPRAVAPPGHAGQVGRGSLRGAGRERARQGGHLRAGAGDRRRRPLPRARGPLRRRRRRVSRASVDEPHRPALRGLVPARDVRRPERPLPGRHAVHEQVPVDGLPRGRLDARPGGARGADRGRRPRARHRLARAAAAQHHPGRRPLPLGDPAATTTAAASPSRSTAPRS